MPSNTERYDGVAWTPGYYDSLNVILYSFSLNYERVCICLHIHMDRQSVTKRHREVNYEYENQNRKVKLLNQSK